jgi:hypothetical protein
MAGAFTHRRTSRDGSGQVLVLFALAIVVLLAAAGLAFDIGRFYSERRFLQNAADAAALAAANSLVRGSSIATADADARAILSRNFAGAPNAVTPSLPPTTPVYETGHSGDPEYLANGILIANGDIRVAIQNSIPYTLARAAGFGASTIGARAHVEIEGHLLPIAVRNFVNAPGPNAGATYPCSDDRTQFMDFFATALTACLGSDSNAGLRMPPTAGNAFDPSDPDSDPTNHGPVVEILGQGAQPANGADFRGFVILDIRNYQSTTSQLYYNGATVNDNDQLLKNLEAAWIAADGYPGPKFPPITSPPDPNDQVGILNGNATGAAIDEMRKRYKPGDVILVAVYSGSTQAIPDFAMTAPGTISLPTSGTTASAGSMKVTRNQAFTGTVALSTVADILDPLNPLVNGTITSSPPISYTPNPVTPSLGGGTVVNLTNITTTGATPGIYTVWVKGEAGSPYLTTKFVPATLNVGSVSRDFSITSDFASVATSSIGATATFNLTLTNAPNKNTAFGGPVTLSIDAPTPTGTGTVTFASSTVTPTKAGASTRLDINTGTLPQGDYRFVVRATGTNGDSPGRTVTHLLPLTVQVTPASKSGSDEYVDLSGFAVMRVAAMDSNSNYVTAYAITPVVTDLNDSRLQSAQRARLVPWS